MSETRYALLIASSNFPEEPKLQPLAAPENDVEGMADVLRAPDRGAFTEVVMLKNRPHYEILRELQRLLNRATKHDLVLIYYSGHGKLNRAGELYLTAVDSVVTELESTAIPVRRLRSFIDVSLVQRVVMIFDSCFSGAAGGVLLRGDVDSQLQLASSQGRGTYIMTASTGIQTAQEKESDQYSVFTKHLISGIKSGDADENGDGQITADELYDYVNQRVRQESHQEPTRWGLDVRGHLVLANSGREPRRERASELRSMLLTFARENRIKDEILVDALRIIERRPDQLSATDQKRDALLDALRQNEIDVLDFVIQWYRIDEVTEKKPRYEHGVSELKQKEGERATRRTEVKNRKPSEGCTHTEAAKRGGAQEKIKERGRATAKEQPAIPKIQRSEESGSRPAGEFAQGVWAKPPASVQGQEITPARRFGAWICFPSSMILGLWGFAGLVAGDVEYAKVLSLGMLGIAASFFVAGFGLVVGKSWAPTLTAITVIVGVMYFGFLNWFL